MSNPAQPAAPVRLIGTVPSSLVLGLGTLISHGFGLALVPAMLPRIATDLDLGYGTLGVTVAVGLVAYSATALATGWILDRVPTRSALIGSYAISMAGLALAGMATSPVLLTAAVVVLGGAAPLSWAVTLHVAGATVAPTNRAVVMATASGGAALGVLINGVLVQTSESIHSWQLSFFIAAAIAILPIASGIRVYREPIVRARTGSSAARGAFRSAFSTKTGRTVVYAGLMAGIAGFPFNVFLTATALDEMQIAAFNVGALWWSIGILGMVAGPVLGRYADRTSPLRALLVGAVMYGIGLGFLLVSWNFAGLFVAAAGYAFMNYPVWGLVGAIANRYFDAGLAVRSISLGLVIASLGGALGNAVAGHWIETTSSFRGPIAVLTAIVWGLVAWFFKTLRSGALESPE